MKRTDIKLQDVFISWTGKDREIKDVITKHLKDNNISVLESDEGCSGDFVQWSKEAAESCSLFLLILTENTLNSAYVPLEVEAFKKMDDWHNRTVPVCADMELYSHHSWGLNESESAVILKNRMPSIDELSQILSKVKSLLIHRQYSIYQKKSFKESSTLIPLLNPNKTASREYAFDSIYQPRTITEVDGRENTLDAFPSPKELINKKEVLFIYGAAGSGKTQYIHQIRACASENDIVISLPCAKVSLSPEPLMDLMYNEFQRICGIGSFYSIDNFKSLLNVKHTVLVLDGMDEIATQTATIKFIKKVDEFYSSNTDTTIIFTSRNADDANTVSLGGKPLRRFILNPLDENQIEKLGENLFLLFGSSEKNNEFYISISQLSDEIKSNPLLLSQLAIVYQNTGKTPKTTVEINDAVLKIILKLDSITDFDAIPESYKEMLRSELDSILKSFSKERYICISRNKEIEITKMFAKILKQKYAEESRARAEFLVEYLQNRSILVDGEFYHKSFLEYFTAVAFYEQAFDDYDEIENTEVIKDLFSHYKDSYWAPVIKLFLAKADSCIDGEVTEKLYSTVISTNEILDYTLLFDTCRELIGHKCEAQTVLVHDILKKSIDGTYPAYGPLFWYVPEYELYDAALSSAAKMLGNPKALALVRDVFFMFGQKIALPDEEATKLYNAAKAELSGIRKNICELFYTGKCEDDICENIYPRCFNIMEAKSLQENSHGIFGRMDIPFDDELGLWKSDALNELNGEYIGVISYKYDKIELERILNQKSTAKVSGIILTPTDNTTLEYIDFIRTSVRVFSIPENIQHIDEYHSQFMQNEIIYRVVDNTLVTLSKDVENLTVADGITVISRGAFKNCFNLKRVYLPDTVTAIESLAFECCYSLEEITLPSGLISIGEHAFYSCGCLEQISLPHTVKQIGDGAFESSGLMSVDLPSSLTAINDKLFYSCFNLSEVNIPEGVASIGKESFYLCQLLEEINLPSSLSYIAPYAFHLCFALKEIIIPDGVTKIEEGTFDSCGELKKIELSSATTSLGPLAFFGCTELEDISLPNTLKDINTACFAHCISLRDIVIPESVEYIHPEAFAFCTELNIKLPSHLIEEYDVSNGNINDESFTFNPLKAKDNRIKQLPIGATSIPANYYEDSQIESIVLPETVTSIGDSAFLCSWISQITFTESVTRIGPSAFRICGMLSEVSLPDSLKVIERETFSGSGLKRIKLPSYLNKIEASAFEDCPIENIELPKSVEVIEERAFYHCKNLHSIDIPYGVSSLEFATFEGCENLSRVTLPSSLKYIHESAFQECTSLEEIILPESLLCIGRYAFFGNTSLSSITVPKNVREILTGAFGNCYNLKRITISSNFKKDIARIFDGNMSVDDIEFIWY